MAASLIWRDEYVYNGYGKKKGMNNMTIKEYILSKQDSYKYEIKYQFICHCPKCNKEFVTVDVEYSSGIENARDFKINSKYSHYRGYPFVYDDFYIDDQIYVKISRGDEEQEIITITVDCNDEMCSRCEEE